MTRILQTALFTDHWLKIQFYFVPVTIYCKVLMGGRRILIYFRDRKAVASEAVERNSERKWHLFAGISFSVAGVAACCLLDRGESVLANSPTCLRLMFCLFCCLRWVVASPPSLSR